ncbi:MAG: MATE family efflux transporter [Prosthecobacter sp.]|jgi:putative MATE family efflux protein|uniref:MATE family efflux transporter n=1 Tax=Prosthecobacter sp. TaxID=1965333 RepID=UPI0019E1C30D|nr:MATE family efflux transporter [Prosthecobacter sp.]MBE2287493.1 MATE family efflux transporter [Prosthecobacter sp.]
MSDESSSSVVSAGFWRSVAQSLRGEEHDYTALPLNRAVVLLAVPMVLEMMMESLFAVADVFWVSRLGKEAVAVVGITESVMTLIYAVAIGISIAATAIVSRRIGEKEPELAAQAAGQIVVLGVVVSVLIGVVLGWLAPDILRLMGAEEAVVRLGGDFARIMLGGNATVFLIFLINAIFRGAGDAVIAMRTLWLANGLNIVLGPCFVFGWWIFPEMGVTGAAVATNIGRGVGVIYQLWHLAGHHSRIKVRREHFKPVREVIGTVLSKSGSGVAQFLISTTSWVGLFKILAMFGSTALAGYTIAIRIVTFALMPAWGLANAGATLVGQNLGAQKPERAEAAVWMATKFNVLVLSGVGVLFVVCAGPLIGFFNAEGQVLVFGTQSLWIVSLAFPLYAAGMCFEAAFNGSGDTWTPARLNFMCLWAGQIPIAWLLSKTLGFGAVGAVISVPVAYSLLAMWSWHLFRRGKWKTQKV